MKNILRLLFIGAAIVALGSTNAFADLRDSATKSVTQDRAASDSTSESADKGDKKTGAVLKWMLKDLRTGSCRQPQRSSAPNTGSWQPRGESAVSFCKP